MYNYYNYHSINLTTKGLYQDFGGIFHEPNAGEWIGDAVEIHRLAIQTVADNVAADDFVLSHLHHSLYGWFGFGLEDSRRGAVGRSQVLIRGRARQERT